MKALRRLKGPCHGLTMGLLALGMIGGALPVMAEAADWPAGSGDGLGGLLIPITALLMVFGAPAVTVVLVALFVFRHRERRQRLLNERIQTLLENGQTVPDALLSGGEKSQSPDRHLHQGLILLGSGAGLLIFLTLLNGFAVGSLGLVLIGPGLAKLLIWTLSRREAKAGA